MAILAIGFGSLQRKPLRPWQRSALQGLLFGAGAVALALSPVRLAHGVPIDGRAIFVGLAAAFGGMPAMIAAAMVSTGARFLMYGLEAYMAVLNTVLGGLIGLSWLRFIRPRLGVTTASLALLGLMISSTMLLVLVLPLDHALELLIEAWPAAICATMVASVVFGSFLNRELLLIEREKALETAAMRDPLTGLRNRRGFDAEVAKKLVSQEAACLLILDLDHFKRINDQHGHPVGDLALRAVALALQSSVRRDDVVGRIGGEEFGIFLPATDLEAATEIAAAVRQRIQRAGLKVDGRQVAITASLGVARARPTDSGATLFRAADAALYAAKRAGRNCVRFALPEPDAAPLGRAA